MKEDIEEIEKFESKYGSLKGWQRIIIVSLMVIIALWELDITV
jgi:hypothetical protein